MSSYNFTCLDLNESSDLLFPEMESLSFTFDQLDKNLLKDNFFNIKTETETEKEKENLTTTLSRNTMTEINFNKGEQPVLDYSSPSSSIELVSSSPLTGEYDMYSPEPILQNFEIQKNNKKEEVSKKQKEKETQQQKEKGREKEEKEEKEKKRSKYIIKKYIKKTKSKRKRRRKIKNKLNKMNNELIRSKTELSQGAIEERQKLIKISNVKEVRKMDATEKYLRRLEKNRLSAKKAREKKKNYWSNLETNYQLVSQENHELKRQLQAKDEELQMLRDLLKKQQNFKNMNQNGNCHNGSQFLPTNNKLDLEIDSHYANDQGSDNSNFNSKKQTLRNSLLRLTTIPNQTLLNQDQDQDQQNEQSLGSDVLSSKGHSRKERIMAGTLFLFIIFFGIAYNWSSNENTITINTGTLKTDLSDHSIKIVPNRNLVSYSNDLTIPNRPSMDSSLPFSKNYHPNSRANSNSHTQSAIITPKEKRQIEAPPSVRSIPTKSEPVPEQEQDRGQEKETEQVPGTHTQLDGDDYILITPPKDIADIEQNKVGQSIKITGVE
ncbi:transcriptional activator hac1 [Anaeramoeba flamelloides]|uniref:Transcriptional activator hac1 n=1 Tax=Anaeramoeba flamelloides TaxID=1746091 RepID=A0ABQ8YTQ0_9EUKA|nr:transcriptional activator hac1 [Anaeramoeba flamelloides]